MHIQVALIVLIILAGVVALAYTYLNHLFNTVPEPKAGGIRVACVGDSITQGMGVMFDQMSRNSYPALLQAMLGDRYQVLNYGHSSRTLLVDGDYPYLRSPFYAASIKSDPAVVLIMLGTNDSKPPNWNALEYERQLAALVDTYKKLASHPSVHLLIPPPAYVKKGKKEVAFKIQGAVIEHEIAPIVKRVAHETQTALVDLFTAMQDHPEYFPDGVHPNAAGNRAIARTVYRVLTQTVDQE